MYTTKLPMVACKIVMKRIIANFVKKMILQKSIMIELANVVIAAAKIDGPM